VRAVKVRKVSTVNFLTVLPLAFVMIAGPQVLSAIFLATSENWQRNTAAFLTGAALSITVIVSIAYLVSSGAPREGGSNDTIDVIILVLLLAAMVHAFLARKTSEPPKWMGRLQTAKPRFSFRLDLRRLRVLVLVDHVLVEALGHQLVGLRFHPGGDERGRVQAGFPSSMSSSWMI
jgi:hypothetical protein